MVLVVEMCPPPHLPSRPCLVQPDMVLLLRTVASVMLKTGLVPELPTDEHVENIASDMYGVVCVLVYVCVCARDIFSYGLVQPLLSALPLSRSKAVSSFDHC